MIRRASAETDADSSMSRDRRDKDIDEYVYDEENYVANKKAHNVSFQYSISTRIFFVFLVYFIRNFELDLSAWENSSQEKSIIFQPASFAGYFFSLHRLAVQFSR